MINMLFQKENTDYRSFYDFRCHFHGIFRELGKCNDSFAALKLFLLHFYSIYEIFLCTMVFSWSTRYIKKLIRCCILRLCVTTAVFRMSQVSYSILRTLSSWRAAIYRNYDSQTLHDYITVSVSLFL